MNSLKIVYLNVEALIAYEFNARRHSATQIDKLALSIKEFGFTQPILIDGSNTVIAGHGRLQAAKLLGMEKVPTITLSELSDEQRRAYILADNRLTEYSSWDEGLLVKELSLLDDMEITGFSEDDLAALERLDSFGEPPEEVKRNQEEIDEIKRQRKEGNEGTASKNDTERYLVIVFPTRSAREVAVSGLGLPKDERYVNCDQVEIRHRFGGGEIISARDIKAADKKRSGAGG